jgi:glutaredoxin-related protein
MRTLPLHLEAGSDVRQSLEALAHEQGAQGYVLSVVGNLSAAVFQCPGKPAPTRLRGELEIITLSGTLSPEGVHLHLSFSDGDCRVWGGHLEPGTLVLRGADLLLGFLEPSLVRAQAAAAPAALSMGANGPVADGSHAARPAGRGQRAAASSAAAPPEPRLEVAVLSGCPWSARALRLLRTLSIPHRVVTVDSEALGAEIRQRSGSTSLPQLFLDGEPIGGYDALAERHGRGELEALRQG